MTLSPALPPPHSPDSSQCLEGGSPFSSRPFQQGFVPGDPFMDSPLPPQHSQEWTLDSVFFSSPALALPPYF